MAAQVLAETFVRSLPQESQVIASLAFRNVLRNKERSLLTLVGVILAIGSFVALVSLAAGFTQRVERELGSREVHIYVSTNRSSALPASPMSGNGGGGPALRKELGASLREVPSIRTVTPVIRSTFDATRTLIPVIAMPLEDAPVVFKGARFSYPPHDLNHAKSDPADKSPKAPATPNSTSRPGNPNLDKPVATLGDKKPVPRKLIVGRGLVKEIEEQMSNGVILIEDIPFRVGESMGADGFLDYTILAPIESFQEQRSDRGVHEYWITLNNEDQVEQAKVAIESVVAKFQEAETANNEYGGVQKIKVLTRRQYLSAARDYLGYGWLLQVAVSMVGVLIAITASMNTMLMSTYERLGEYATLRAVGASRRVIALTIIYEAIFLNVTGGFLGLLFGYLATGVLDKAVGILLEIPYPMAGVTPMLMLQALGLSFIVGLVGAIIPCFIVSRIDLVAQLRKGM